MDQVTFSRHAVERFAARLVKKNFKHVSECHLRLCKTCNRIRLEALGKVRADRYAVEEQLARSFRRAREISDKTQYVDGRKTIVKLYGYSRIIFVVSVDDVIPHVITCYVKGEGGLPQGHDRGTGNRKRH